MYAQKDLIESEIGMELEWDKLEKNKISKIGKTLNIDVSDRSIWEKAITWQYEMAVKLREILLPRIK